MNDVSNNYPIKEVDCTCTQVLGKDMKLLVRYYKDNDQLVNEKEDYHRQHETPFSLIREFLKVLDSKELPKNINYWKKECNGWDYDPEYIDLNEWE